MSTKLKYERIRDKNIIGDFKFTFDGGKTVYHIFGDFPEKLSKEELELFYKEDPAWAKEFGNEL